MTIPTNGVIYPFDSLPVENNTKNINTDANRVCLKATFLYCENRR